MTPEQRRMIDAWMSGYTWPLEPAVRQAIRAALDENARPDRCIQHAAYNPEGDCLICDRVLAQEEAEALREENARLKALIPALESALEAHAPSHPLLWKENV